ncbi:MAG: hypothetical protein ACOVRN_18735 [Flavobacterium sp.]
MELLFKQEEFPVRHDPLKGVPNRNSRRYKSIRDSIEPQYVYTWSLERYLGEELYSSFDFQPDLRTFPAVGIITSEDFIRNLNDWKCFGNLDYLPAEGDFVTIRYCFVDFSTNRHPDSSNLWTISWMQAIFNNDKWIRDRYYGCNSKLIAEGLVYIG